MRSILLTLWPVVNESHDNRNPPEYRSHAVEKFLLGSGESYISYVLAALKFKKFTTNYYEF